MLSKGVVSSLRSIKNVVVRVDEDISTYTTMRLKAKGNIILVACEQALKNTLLVLNESKTEYRVVGWGANQVIQNNASILYIKLNFPFDKSFLEPIKDSYRLPASFSLSILTGLAIKHGLKGWEVFTGIPASLGGAVFMNAGTSLGEIGPLIEKVELFTKNGEKKIVEENDLHFSYRKNHFVEEGDIITYVTIRHHGFDAQVSRKIKDYLTYRKNTQPMGTRNCGCVFKNIQDGIPAGMLIESLGMKGFNVGNLQVSTKHSNFIENLGNATFDEFAQIKGIIKSVVEDNTGFTFELEVKT